MGGRRGDMSWAVEVTTVGSEEWVGNQITYDTEAEARQAASDLFRRWMAVGLWRVVEVDA